LPLLIIPFNFPWGKLPWVGPVHFARSSLGQSRPPKSHGQASPKQPPHNEGSLVEWADLQLKHASYLNGGGLQTLQRFASFEGMRLIKKRSRQNCQKHEASSHAPSIGQIKQFF
jgi:hypothetical protein